MSNIHLDVRSMPVPERHPKILEALEGLANGQTLTITSDHEPRPLRAELEKQFGMRLRWGQSNLGDGRWQVRLVKLEIDGLSPAESTLQRCDAFADVGLATLRDLAYYSRRTAIKRQHCVVEQGVLWPYLGVVDTGVVQAQYSARSGQEQALYDLQPGDAFAETALLDDGHTAMRYVALTSDATVVLVPKERVHAAMQRDVNMRSGIERTAAQHSRAIVERFAELRSLSSTGKLAAVLLPYARPEPGLSEPVAPLSAMTQIDLAMKAGSAKEVVSRALRELELVHAIERNKGRLVKLDRERLVYAINNL